MSPANSYEHKKFDLKTQQYKHKKFGVLSNKRKYYEEEKENLQPITAQTILDRGAKETQQQLLPAKRRQTKPLFRPWLEEAEMKPACRTTSKVLTPLNTNILSHHQGPHKNTKKLSESKQQRRKRNNLASPSNQSNKLEEQLFYQQQYAAYQQYQALVIQQNIKTALYLKHLHQLNLQRQGQLFVFGQ
ncbi:uncharacterized protein LOC135950885 [Calliphora vicina]|uniref:uncharacterized protein LOC135950885 n=1 Tax=Calliphora vicina TaxID=7373 RepID=UPI00325B2FCE